MSNTVKAWVSIILICTIGFTFWSLISSFRSKATAQRERERAAAQKKFEEVKVTLIEGKTNLEFYTTLEKQGLGKVADYRATEQRIASSNYEVLADKPSKLDLQGFLFPDTYRFAKTATTAEVLDELLQTFTSKFNQASSDSLKKAGYFILPGYENYTVGTRVAPGLTVLDIVTLASILEKETGRTGESATSNRLLEERRTVAGIFLNRLQLGMPLQSDATVNFVTKAGLASPTLDQTKVDSPYNTYKYAGLPPGPIANVSYSSLHAVLHPIKTNYLYFLHEQTNGEVHYAADYDTHLRNKQEYLK